MKFKYIIKSFAAILLAFASSAFVWAQTTLSLEKALSIALANDPIVDGHLLNQQAKQYQSVAAGSLPDPKVSLALANLPTDNWNLEQEGMSQINLGVSQVFPRGESLAIKQQQLNTAAGRYRYLQEERRAAVKKQVSVLWLEAFLAENTIKAIKNERALFEQMVEVAVANYATVVGKTRQHDVIRAQLGLAQLDDRLLAEQQTLMKVTAQLNEWLHVVGHQEGASRVNFNALPNNYLFAERLPNIELNLGTQSVVAALKQGSFSRNEFATLLANHPAVLALDVKQQIAKQEVSLTEQQYKPQWAVNASYGFRDADPMGKDRADLFSIGVTMDLPLFTEQRQDKLVAAAIVSQEAIKTEMLALIKQMLAAIESEYVQLERLGQRQQLYQTQLLRQSHDQAEASLTAYTNNDGNFSDVVSARITELNTRIAALKIDVDALKTVVRLNYLLSQSSSTVAMH